ncbi:TRAP transporter small permease [Desulfosarcina alkanivorans]|nr:TRAP transporter small permease [Desulfosarcina alkanivorans]
MGGAVCLVAMTIMTCADVVGRYLGHPILGSVEIAGFMATMAAALALPYTHRMRGHIGVEVVVRLLSQRTQAAIGLCTNTLAFLMFAVISWRMANYAETMRRSGEVSISLEFPEHTIIYITAFCFLILTLNLLEDVLKDVNTLMGKK